MTVCGTGATVEPKTSDERVDIGCHWRQLWAASVGTDSKNTGDPKPSPVAPGVFTRPQSCELDNDAPGSRRLDPGHPRPRLETTGLISGLRERATIVRLIASGTSEQD